jgi:hypothetical protein
LLKTKDLKLKLRDEGIQYLSNPITCSGSNLIGEEFYARGWGDLRTHYRVEAERPARQAMSIFYDLYPLQAQLEREAERLKLVYLHGNNLPPRWVKFVITNTAHLAQSGSFMASCAELP